MAFFKPAWQSDNKEKALKAVSKVTDQIILAEIIKNAPLGVVKESSLKKITDHNILIDIANNTKGEYKQSIQNMALAELTELINKASNQNLLTDTLSKCQRTSIQSAIRKRLSILLKESITTLTDQAILADIIANHDDVEIRKVALERLTDQNLLADVAKSNENVSVRIEAAERLINQTLAQEVYADFVEKGRLLPIRLVESLNNELLKQKAFANYALDISRTNLHRQDLCFEAFERLTDIDLLISIAKNERYNACRNAIERLKRIINSLYNKDMLMEIINGSAKKYKIYKEINNLDMASEVGNPNYTEICDIDLRDIAGKRLAELTGQQYIPIHTTQRKEGNGQTKNSKNAVETMISKKDTDQIDSLLNDFEFIVQSLTKSRKVKIRGAINGTVIMTPDNAHIMQDFPHDSECLYQIPGLNSGWHGDLVYRIMDNPNDNYVGDFVPHYGFPNVCLTCGKPTNKYELLIALVSNNRRMGRLVIDAGNGDDNTQDVYIVLKNTRHFFAIPRCNEHFPISRFFFGNGSLFTDDENIAKIYLKHTSRYNQHLLDPIRVVNGKIIRE